jgi:FlaA1/EpsC-like NDP-sugar epimerase
MKNILNFTNFNVSEINQNINIENIDFNNLLDREPIIINNEESINLLSNKNIIITGGTGSIGSEIIIQLLTLGINNLFLIDNSEFGHYNLKIKLKKLFPKINIKYFLRDIKNVDEMNKIFSIIKPEFIFHVAAYKHVPIMEDNPYEAISTNVIGTKIIADLSIKYNVKKFLFVSTDKAVNPTNIMGSSKRISELYVLQCDKNSKTKFVITRFGNVLGSSGSVIPVFIDNINNNCNLELTHKDVTRYFISIPEAASLVIKAITISNGGQILLFDMGSPIKIFDLAGKILNLCSKKLSINITGLRPGEKLYEELIYNQEEILPTNEKNIIFLKNNQESINFSNNYNKLISHYNNMSEKELRDILKLLVPTFEYTQ